MTEAALSFPRMRESSVFHSTLLGPRVREDDELQTP